MLKHKINDHIVQPVPIECIDKEKIRGYCLFPEIYANVFACAKKKKGKSSVFWKILKECVGRDTKIIIFASTVNKDPTYVHIVEHFQKKGNTVLTYNSIREGKVDNLDDILKTLQDEAMNKPEEEEKEKPKQKICIFDYFEEKQPKKRKEKLVSPEIIFVFDDLSTELKSPSVARLLKSNRHWKSKVLIASQYPNDLLPESRKQIDYALLFSGHTIEKLETLHKDFDLSIPFEDFVEIYDDATSEKFNFLYIDISNETFRKNFNFEYK